MKWDEEEGHRLRLLPLSVECDDGWDGMESRRRRCETDDKNNCYSDVIYMGMNGLAS